MTNYIVGAVVIGGICVYLHFLWQDAKAMLMDVDQSRPERRETIDLLKHRAARLRDERKHSA